jgi:hypothetical protein
MPGRSRLQAQLINHYDRLLIVTLLPLSIVSGCVIILIILRLPCISQVCLRVRVYA